MQRSANDFTVPDLIQPPRTMFSRCAVSRPLSARDIAGTAPRPRRSSGTNAKPSRRRPPAVRRAAGLPQMLRSASDKMVELEGKSVTAAEHVRVHDKCGHNTIYQAMVHLIESGFGIATHQL